MTSSASVPTTVDLDAGTLGDAAAILQQHLTHIRYSWLDLLRDTYRCRHRRRTPGEYKLLSVARVRMPGGGIARPVFATSDIDRFMQLASAATRHAGSTPTVRLRMPLADLKCSWQMRRAEVVGATP